MISIEPGRLDHATLVAFHRQPQPVQLTDDCWTRVDQARQTVYDLIEREEVVYGLNTGFGLLANQRISHENLAQLQINLVRSHSAGCGPLLSDSVVRMIMLLKAASLARGYSGVRREVIEMLLAMLNADLLPCIPSQGSVGASGDLAPLAHMSLAMIGEGRLRKNGVEMGAAAGLRSANLQPLELGPKEGLALLNGTQVSTALALTALVDCERTFQAALAIGSMTVDATMGSDTPFDPRIHEIRNHPGQIDCASAYRAWLADSEIRRSHVDCSRVQDPYSLRCQPQVMGACLESLRHAAQVLLREANAVSDNPLVFAEDHSILSGGNFHAEPVAMVADQMAVAIAEIGALSERRMALLVDRHLSHLPAFLTENGGLNSGFMIPQVTSAALASENKQLATPASVDSLPTSANQEDHVSMATYAARRLHPMLENTNTILAIELLAAAEGIDFRAPLKTSPRLQELHRRVRDLVPRYEQDRVFADDIRRIKSDVVAVFGLEPCCPVL
ncbi:MAG: histidine ammonia-lyase [Pirellulaceae bacterium]|nr:histidine ammonia-lyase [Pirellulaceae bacterium]